MKPETVEFLKGVGWAVAAVLLALAFWAVSSPAHAQVPEGLEAMEMPMRCNDTVCMVPKTAILSLLVANQQMEKALIESGEKAKTPPQCATVEVVPDKPKVEIKADPRTRRSS